MPTRSGSMALAIIGGPHAKILRAIELFGTSVAPAVREAVAKSEIRN